MTGRFLFGRLKMEFFHGVDWGGVSIERFIGEFDAYLERCRGERLKGDPDYRSPMQYRRDLGLPTAFWHWLIQRVQMGAKIIPVDSVFTWWGARAEIWLPLRPYTDAATAYADLVCP